MQGSITGDALFAQVVMQRQVDTRLCLLVEGDDELAILTGHVDDHAVFVLMGGGKPALLRAAALIDLRNYDRALALIDRDLDDFTGKASAYPPSLVATIGYDFDSDVLGAEPGLLRRAAVSQVGPATIKRIENTCAAAFSDVIFALATSFAGLRLLNEEDALGLNLRAFPFLDIVGSDFQLLPMERVLERANERSAVTIAYADVQSKIDSAQARVSTKKTSSCGHDIFGATAAVLRKAGANNASIVQIAASVHTATSCLIISQLHIYRLIEAWAAQFSMRAFSC